MDVQAVRHGLAVNAATLPGLNAHGHVPDSIVEPCFYAGEVTIDLDRTYGGDDDIEVTCRILVSRSDDRDGQIALDGYLSRGPSGLKAALESDPTLGGACDDLHVRRVQGYRLYVVGDTQFYGAELVVRVIG